MIDINLDTFPWNGGITSFESTFMGVPTLTMENNNSFYLRIGESINSNQNMINWIAKNEDDYIKKAVEFAETKKYLSNKKVNLQNLTGKKDKIVQASPPHTGSTVLFNLIYGFI